MWVSPMLLWNFRKEKGGEGKILCLFCLKGLCGEDLKLLR